MFYTDFDSTFIPRLRKDCYKSLCRYAFEGRNVIDLGAGPLTLLYELAVQNEVASYWAVDNNPSHVEKLRAKLHDKPRVVEVAQDDVLTFLEKEITGKDLTFVCSGVEKEFLNRKFKETEDKLLDQIQRAQARYLGVCSAFFMRTGWISGELFHDRIRGLQVYQNGDHILIAQNKLLPSEVCIKTDGISLGGAGRPFGEFDKSFKIPFYGDH